MHLCYNYYGTTEKRLKKIVNIINQQNPKVVIIGGDFISSKLQPKLISLLKNINAKYKLAVFGNHDAEYLVKEEIGGRKYKIPEKFIKEVEELTGFNFLINQSVQLEVNGELLEIGGIPDLYSRNFDLEKTFKDESKINSTTEKSQVPKRILISHNPDIIDFIKPEDNIDLILSGHNHGGQINIKPLGSIIPMPSKYKWLDQGLFRIGKTVLYLSSGSGFGGTRLRIGTKAEVVRISN